MPNLSNENLYHLGRVHLIKATRHASLVQLVRSAHAEDFDGEDSQLFFFRAEISNNLLDSHFTRMNDATLRNYAGDAERGVAFLTGHDWHSLPVGYSLTGVLEEGDKKRVVSDFYTVTGIPETDGMIKRMKAGLLRDVSVGFHGGRMVCDVCESELWDCRHFPGITYEDKGTDGVVRKQVATFTIDNAKLSEVSGVFDGSTPDAMVLKAERAAKAGELTQEQVEILQQRYRTKLPLATKKMVGGFEREQYMQRYETQGEKEMTEEEVGRLRTTLRIAPEADIFEASTGLRKQLDELTPLAEDGKQYRSDLVTEALAEGVRAQGNEFDSATYEAVLRSSSIVVIKRMRDDWKRVADKALPSGRHTTEADNKQEKKKSVAIVPDSAYA